MRFYKPQLKNELLTAGASQGELAELLPLANELRSLSGARPTVFKYAKPFGFVASGLVAGAFLVIVSQAALPTSWLYPVQKFSDDVAVSLHSQYRANIMMKRAQQVNQLVAEHASTKRVLTTLADYTSQASTYKSTPHASYAAFDYCKTNLKQASATATPAVRQAISSSLRSLET